jgi:flagellar basal-body rod protein FlgB
MFIDRLINQGNIPLLEQMVRFTAARARVLGENITNISTPNYQQKDLSLDNFQQELRDRVALRKDAGPGEIRFEGIEKPIESPDRNILFHDRNNRSVEKLMSDWEQNAMSHNLMTELLRKQFSSIQDALKERVT